MRTSVEQTILDAKGATGVGNSILVEDFKNIALSFATDGGGDAALTVKFQGSIQDNVDFSAAQSVTNMWDYIEVVDLEDGTVIDGDTGISVATADDYRLFEMNTGVLKWINAHVSARTEGEVTIKTKLFSND